MRYSKLANRAMLTAIAELLEGGSLRIYDLSPPSTPDAKLTSQAHLATLDFSEVLIGGRGGLTATFEDGLALASGRAAWAQCLDRQGKAVFDCIVGEDQSDCAIEMNTTDFRQGGPVVVRSFALEE